MKSSKDSLVNELDNVKKLNKSYLEAVNYYNRFKLLNPIVIDLIENELNNMNKNENGFRYTDQLKMLCLYIHQSSPKTYKTLATIFNWPSEITLNKIIDKNFYKTGLSSSMVNLIQNCMPNCNNSVYTLVVDEVHIKPELTYDDITGTVDGKSDLGEELKSEPKIAKSSLTFMLCSIDRSIKVPLCFFLIILLLLVMIYIFCA